MATKCITITQDAYERLASMKEKNESFSEVIKKLTSKHSLLDLVGLLSHEEAAELRTHVRELRERMRKEMEERMRRFQ